MQLIRPTWMVWIVCRNGQRLTLDGNDWASNPFRTSRVYILYSDMCVCEIIKWESVSSTRCDYITKNEHFMHYPDCSLSSIYLLPSPQKRPWFRHVLLMKQVTTRNRLLLAIKLRDHLILRFIHSKWFGILFLG